MGTKRFFERLFFGVASAAALFTGIEMVMQVQGASICVTEGCAVVAQHTRFGDLSILLIGFVTFTLLAVLTALDLRSGTARHARLTALILVVSLASEGFFTGYQAFHVRTACLFCLIVFGIIVLLSAVRLLAGDRDVLAGFASFAAVFSLLYLVLPAGAVKDLPKDDRLVLFVSPECRHCAEVKQKIEKGGMTVTHLAAAEYAEFLKRVGIEHVPTLYVNTPVQKTFLTGKEAILDYLFPEQTSKRSSRAPAPAPAGASAPLLPILPSDQIFGPNLLDDGACKPEAVCK